MTDFYSHHNVSTSIMYNLIKVMIRTIDEDDVCLISEQLFEKFWFDSVLLPLYSGIRVTHYYYNSSTQTVKVFFESCDGDLGFDDSIFQRFLKSSHSRSDIVEEVTGHTAGKRIQEYHSSDELMTSKIPLEKAINWKNIRNRHYFLQVLMLDEKLDRITENWCRICLQDDKSLEIPGIDREPRAILLNPRFESYCRSLTNNLIHNSLVDNVCRVVYDDETLKFLLSDQKLVSLPDSELKLSVYLSGLLAAGNRNSATELSGLLRACLAGEDLTLQRLLGDKITSS